MDGNGDERAQETDSIIHTGQMENLQRSRNRQKQLKIKFITKEKLEIITQFRDVKDKKASIIGSRYKDKIIITLTKTDNYWNF